MRQQAWFSAITAKMLMLLLFGIVTWHVTSSNAMAVSRSRRVRDIQPLNDSYFANNLFQEIAKTESGDFVCSPISANMVLSMAATGAKSSTGQQLRSALGIPNHEVPAEYLAKIRSLIDSFDTYDEVDLRLAHKMFLAKRFALKQNFVDTTKNAFRSEAQTIDFGDASAARTAINDWCADQTNDRLTNVIDADDITSKTSIVLVNVAYFSGRWASPFPRGQTEPREFWVDGTSPENPMTMYRFGFYRYGEIPEVDAKFVELPYSSKSESDAVSMFVIVPNQRNGLAKMKNNLGKITLDKLRKGNLRQVHVYLPKFNVESSINLAPPLNQLGLTDMFDRKADFKGISDGRQLKVSKAIQKVALDVDEGGTEAAVANMIFVSDDITTPKTDTDIEFKANHPFACLIVTKSGVTLFSAIISSSDRFELVQNGHFGQHPVA